MALQSETGLTHHESVVMKTVTRLRFTPVFLRRLLSAGLGPLGYVRRWGPKGNTGSGHVPAGIAC